MVVDLMNDMGSCELKLLYGMNMLRFGMIRTILNREPIALNAMNSSGLWMT